MNIAITGASGHIGVNLCRRLSQKKHKLKVLIHKNFKGLESLSMETIQGDLMVPDSLQALVQDVDIVKEVSAGGIYDSTPVQDLSANLGVPSGTISEVAGSIVSMQISATKPN